MDQTSVYDVDGYAYIYVEKVTCVPCENIEEIDLTKDLLLSQFQSNTWYKVDLAKVTGDLSVHFVNDLTCAASVTAYTYATCDTANIENEIPLHEVENREIALGFDTLATCSYDRFLDQTSVYDVDGYAYIYVKEVQTTKHPGYAVIKDTICDGATYVDPITNEEHVIASYEPFTWTWTSTKSVSPCIDSVYTFEITPIVAPDTITVAFLEEIGAMPKLEAAKMVDVTGTIETILKHYEDNTSETVAPVTNVYWTAGHEALLDCDQTSHSMSLVVEAGCGFEVPATLTFPVTPATRPRGDVFAPTLCHDDEYKWNGVTYSIANGNVVVGANADVVYPNDAACDEKVDTLRLTVLPKPIEVITDTTICHGESITWIDGNVYNSTIQGKSYSKPFAGHTCDSIVGTLNLTVLPKPDPIVVKDTICPGESKDWNGEIYDKAGSYTITLEDVAGCDSIVTLHLTVLPEPIEVITDTTICHGESITWIDGNVYNSTIQGKSYSKPFAGHTCDSIVGTLNLTVLPKPDPIVVKDTICPGESKDWNGEIYDKAGSYTITLEDVAGCDSIVTLHLTVLPEPIEVITDTTICHGESITWIDGNVYNSTIQGKSYSKPFAGHTCDSIVGTLNLTVLPKPEDIVEYDTICSGDTLEWYPNPNDLNVKFEYTKAGTYYHDTLTNENGCEYTATLHLYVADADNVPEYDNLDAVGKYGDRLLLLNLNRLNELATADIIPAVPNAANVTWYRVNGERDSIADILNGRGDDEAMPNSNSYYYNNADGSPLMAGNYYVLMNLPGAEGECPTYLRSVEVELGQSASLAPQLVPTIASPNADIRLLNLNPSAVTEIRVYNTTGDLQAVYTASEVADFMFKAATTSGYYMVEVQSDGEKVTLRYIVK